MKTTERARRRGGAARRRQHRARRRATTSVTRSAQVHRTADRPRLGLDVEPRLGGPRTTSSPTGSPTWGPTGEPVSQGDTVVVTYAVRNIQQREPTASVRRTGGRQRWFGAAAATSPRAPTTADAGTSTDPDIRRGREHDAPTTPTVKSATAARRGPPALRPPARAPGRGLGAVLLRRPCPPRRPRRRARTPDRRSGVCRAVRPGRLSVACGAGRSHSACGGPSAPGRR